MASPSPSKIADLEGLRGACACMVMLVHAADRLPKTGPIWKFVGAIPSPYGFSSVIVFFILSGFVIGHSTKGTPTGDNVVLYLQKRFIRLYPIYLVALVLSFAVAGVSLASSSFIGHLLFMQGALVPVIESNGPLWSLNNEALYYLIFIGLWLWPRAVPITGAVALAALALATVSPTWYANLIGYFCFWLFGLMLSREHPLLSKVLVKDDAPKFWLPLLLLGANMATGAPAALAKQIGIHSGFALLVTVNAALIFNLFLSFSGRRLISRVAVPFYTVSIITTVIGVAYGLYAGKIPDSPEYGVALLYLTLALLVWVFGIKSPTRRSWSKLEPLGRISYALYVVHYPVLFFAAAHFPDSVLAVVLAVVFAVVTAIVLEVLLQPKIRAAFFALVGRPGTVPVKAEP